MPLFVSSISYFLIYKPILTMSKFDDCIDTYKKQLTKLKVKVDEKLLRAVAKACGPSLYNKDASTVAGSDPAELNRIKKGFCAKKLGVKPGAKLDSAMDNVMKKMGKGNRNKYRAVVYYLLTKELKKTSKFK